jgi:hypothetical protein
LRRLCGLVGAYQRLEQAAQGLARVLGLGPGARAGQAGQEGQGKSRAAEVVKSHGDASGFLVVAF